jgi:hypothetical protein
MIRRVAFRCAIAVLLVGGAAGCDDSSAPLIPCAESVTLSATRGTTPTIRWSPSCLAGSIIVEPLPLSQGFDTHWSVAAGTDLLAPGLRYGRLPGGATQNHAAIPLDPAEPYTVLLFSAEGELIAEREFTP